MEYYLFDELTESKYINFTVSQSVGTIEEFYNSIIYEVKSGSKYLLTYLTKKHSAYKELKSKYRIILNNKVVTKSKQYLIKLNKLIYTSLNNIVNYKKKIISKVSTFEYNCNRVKNNLVEKIKSRNNSIIDYNKLMKINKPVFDEYNNYFEYIEDKLEKLEDIENQIRETLHTIDLNSEKKVVSEDVKKRRLGKSFDEQIKELEIYFKAHQKFIGVKDDKDKGGKGGNFNDPSGFVTTIGVKLNNIENKVEKTAPSSLTKIGISAVICIASYIILYAIVKKITKKSFSIVNISELIKGLKTIYKTGKLVQKIVILSISVLFIASLGYLGYNGIKMIINYFKNKK